MTRFLTAAEMAGRLRCSVWHLRDLVRAGRVPAVRLVPRGRLLFDPEDVERAVRGPTPAAAPATSA